MGKKKAKEKKKDKTKSPKVSRENLQDEIDQLRQLNDQLQARLQQIAEIAGARAPGGESNGSGSEQPSV